MSFAVMNASKEFVLVVSEMDIRQVTVGSLNASDILPPSIKRFDSVEAVEEFMSNWRWRNWFLSKFGEWMAIPIGPLYETRPMLVGFCIAGENGCAA